MFATMDRKRFIASLGALVGGAALYPLLGEAGAEEPIPTIDLKMHSRVLEGGPPRARTEVRLAVETMRKVGTLDEMAMVALDAYIDGPILFAPIRNP